MAASRNAATTIALSAFALILGVPAAVAAILFNHTWVPNVILGTKTVKSGLNNATTVLEFGLLSGPDDAVYASGLISMTSTVLIVIGLVLIRHFVRHNIWGWLAFGPAFLNFLGTAGACAAAYLLKSRYPRATSTDQIRYNNDVYDTGGKLYTREGWACSMNALYADREGHWAKKACSNFGTARLLTLPIVACAACLCAVVYWQIYQLGGFGWLFGRRDRVIAAYKPKGDYIDLQG